MQNLCGKNLGLDSNLNQVQYGFCFGILAVQCDWI